MRSWFMYIEELLIILPWLIGFLPIDLAEGAVSFEQGRKYKLPPWVLPTQQNIAWQWAGSPPVV